MILIPQSYLYGALRKLTLYIMFLVTMKHSTVLYNKRAEEEKYVMMSINRFLFSKDN